MEIHALVFNAIKIFNLIALLSGMILKEKHVLIIKIFLRNVNFQIILQILEKMLHKHVALAKVIKYNNKYFKINFLKARIKITYNEIWS